MRGTVGGASEGGERIGRSDATMRHLFKPLDQAAFSNNLGEQIRAIRRSQHLTLEAVSSRSGISTGALSQVERGVGNPAFFTLIKIAHALRIPLTSLLQIERWSSPVVSADKRRPLAPHFFDEDGARSELLTPDLDTPLQVCRYVLPPGATTEETPFVHSGEEFITVLAGRCVVVCGAGRYELGSGDSITYDAAAPHWFGNPGARTARLLFVCTPPTF